MQNQRGQVLLIVIMLLATVLTVVLSVTFKSTTETQITKLEEESQKALAAAEAGIEKLLETGSTVTLESLPSFSGSGISGQASLVSSLSTKFNSIRLSKDQQYTFYLDDYSDGAFAGTPFSGDIIIYYGDGSVTCDSVALEISILSGASPNYIVERYVADIGNDLGSETLDIGNSSGGSVNDGTENVSYNCKTDTMTIPAQAKLMIVRVLGNGTRLGADGGVTNLKAQGKTISSEARTAVGATKRVQLFQSYPQIPSDFFVTSF